MAKLSAKEIAANLSSLTDEDLAVQNHSDLYTARSYFPKGEEQNRLAAYEHRAFAREFVADKPYMAPSLIAASALYQPYKMVGSQARSDPSVTQMLQGWLGTGEGIVNSAREAGNNAIASAKDILNRQASSISSHIANINKDSQETGLLAALQSYQPTTNTTNKLRQ